MKSILSYIVLLSLLATSALAQSFTTTALTGATPASVATSRLRVVNVTATATTANNTTIYLYDSNSTNTYLIQPAYTAVTTYTTNFSTTFTNQNGVVVTNTFDGIYTATSTTAAATNEMTRRLTLIVPASSTRTYNVSIPVAFGVAALSDYNAVLELEYRQ